MNLCAISDDPGKPPRRMQRYVRFGLIIVFVGFILVNIAASLHAYRLTRFNDYADGRPVPEKMSAWERAAFAVTGRFAPKSHIKAQPDFAIESVKLATSDGNVLSAWISRSGPQTTATVILCHGHGASRSALLEEAAFFRELGFGIMMFDFRAHGESSGNVCSVGYYEMNDVKAAWDYVRARYPQDHVIIYGISMGAVAAARAMAEHDLKPLGLILEMPFNRLIDAVRSRVRLMELPAEPASALLTFWGGVQLGFWPFGFETSDYISDASCPILLQWGSEDQRVSREEVLAIKSAAPAGKLHLEVYDGLGHSSIARRANGHWTHTVRRWLTSIVPNTAATDVASASVPVAP